MDSFPKVVVLCMSCGTLAPYDTPNGSQPFGVWHWHQSCPNCGAENWAAHDTDRDWRTGKKLESPSQFAGKD